MSNPIFGLRVGAGFLAPKPATETNEPGRVSAGSSEAVGSRIAGAAVGLCSVRTARSPVKPRAQAGFTAIELTAWTSPPMKAEVELVRTVIDDGLETQCAAVSTLVGERTDPVQRVWVVRTAAVNPQLVRLAGAPPTTLVLARASLAAAVPTREDASNPVAQTSATASLAIRDGIRTPIGSAALALEPERSRDGVGGPRRRVGRRVGLVQVEPAGMVLHQPEKQSLDPDLQAERLGRGEGPAVRDRRLPTHALEHGGAGDVAVDRADRERLEPLLDPDLPGWDEVHDGARLRRDRTVPTACDLRSGSGLRGRDQKRPGDGKRDESRPRPCSAHPALPSKLLAITGPQYHGSWGSKNGATRGRASGTAATARRAIARRRATRNRRSAGPAPRARRAAAPSSRACRR